MPSDDPEPAKAEASAPKAEELAPKAEASAPKAKGPASKVAARKKRRWPRRLGMGLSSFVVLLAALWMGVHRIPGFGAALVDAARAVLGARAVAWIEDVAYGVEDHIKHWFLHGSKPAQFWEAPAPGAEIIPEAGFPPPAFSPPFAEVAAPGDGHWAAVPDGPMVDGRPVLVRSVVHPDP